MSHDMNVVFREREVCIEQKSLYKVSYTNSIEHHIINLLAFCIKPHCSFSTQKNKDLSHLKLAIPILRLI